MFEGQEIDITWFFFKREFFKKFIPEHIRYRKMRDFETLVQGGMTVMEYSKKLTELSNFAEALVATKELKKDRFIEGLGPDIRKDIRMHEPKTHAKALRKAFVAKESNKVIHDNTQLIRRKTKQLSSATTIT